VFNPSALLTLILTCSLSTSAQTFEAASIRPSPEINTSTGTVYFGSRGGPGTDDPGRYRCDFCELSELIAAAYDVPEYRLVTPKPLPTTRYHVVAAIAPATTRDQFHLMLQNLLAERFSLKVHHEQREITAHRLVIAHGGLKLKPHVDGAPAKAIASKPQPGYSYKTHATLTDFAKVVEHRMNQPVVDATGLTGTYDFDLAWTVDDLDANDQPSSDLPTLRSAIQSIGLKIESHKEPTVVIVVDDIAKSPSTN
jgi:uncharacterized protein (TIGR03435 family)